MPDDRHAPVHIPNGSGALARVCHSDVPVVQAYLLKNEPSEVNMRVEVKEVTTPISATAAKCQGASLSAAAPAGKRNTR